MSTMLMESNTRIFNPHQASMYLESLRRDQNLMTLIRYNHQFDWNKNEGLKRDEMEKIASRCYDLELRKLYDLALETLTDNDQSTLLASNDGNNDPPQSNTLRKSYVLYAEKRDDKYNIVSASAIQTKELDWSKTMTAGLTAFLASVGAGAIIGAAAGSAIGPVGSFVGGVLGGSVGGAAGASGVAGKAYHDYHQIMPEAVYAYVLQELQEKQILQISNNKLALQSNQN
ncbi:unnamed protein product [Adineta steineri]|uniref:Glycine zipper domain-containing protein n=1 Tax=Adineta steineri TaxID=433720 RepID=A0A818NNW3_9BILA|nr:unnamed protein product [Adineta steineri]CAF3606745.1 unnamed protein product [Adineta steineri]